MFSFRFRCLAMLSKLKGRNARLLAASAIQPKMQMLKPIYACRRQPANSKHVRCQADQFHKDGACSTGIRAGKANIDVDIAPFLPTQLPQFLPQRRDLSLCRGIALSIPHQYADAPHPVGLLRLRRERPRHRRAAEQRNEVATSARARLQDIELTIVSQPTF